jgi:hypothetical protein
MNINHIKRHALGYNAHFKCDFLSAKFRRHMFIKCRMDERTYGRMDFCLSNGWMDDWTVISVNECMNGWSFDRLGSWVNGWLDEQMGERIIGCMNEWVNGRMDAWLNYLMIDWRYKYTISWLQLSISMDESPSWEADNRQASHETILFLWNTKVYYGPHSRKPRIPILYQCNPVHTRISYLFIKHYPLVESINQPMSQANNMFMKN